MQSKANRITLTIMIALTVLFLAIGLLVVYTRIHQGSSTPSNSNNQTDTQQSSATKTYTNTTVGFQFDYPSSFSDPINLNLTATKATPTSDYFNLVLNNQAAASPAIAGTLIFNVKPLTADEINLSLDDLIAHHSANVKSQGITNLGGEDARRLSFTKGTISLGGVQTTVTNYDVVFVRHNNYLIWVEIKPDPAAKDYANSLFNSVLSTFAFTMTSQPTNNTPDPNAPPTVQSFTVIADDSTEAPPVIVVTKGTIVDLTFNVSPSNTNHGGLDFRSLDTSTGMILPGISKTIAFTATQSFQFIPYWPGSVIDNNYVIQVSVQ